METVYELLNKYVELIKKDYCSDCNELNCISNFPNKDIANAIQQLLQENKELKGKLKKIEEYIYNYQLFGMRYGKTLYRESLINILKIIKGGKGNE